MYKWLYSKSLLYALLGVIIQQLMVASSTLWIVLLSKAVTSQNNIFIWLILFFASLSLVYLPSSLTAFFLGKAKFCALFNYIDQFCSSFQGKATLYTSKELKKLKKPYITHEAWLVIEEALQFSTTFLSLLLNVILNILAISFLINTAFLWSYALAFIWIVLSLSLTVNLLGTLSQKAQSKRTLMMDTLHPSWDSVLIDNSWNLQVWKKKWFLNHKNAQDTHLNSIYITEIVTCVSMLISLLPIFYVIFFEMRSHLTETAILVSLVAVLPRQVFCIQNMGDIVLYGGKLSTIRGKIKGLQRALLLPENSKKYEGSINWEKIEVKNREHILEKIVSFDSLVHLISNTQKGRLTMRGSNGSGKSTLLAHIKQHFTHRAFLLPANSSLLFSSIDDRSFSSGEKATRIIDEILDNIDTPIVLLDEWDANLDAKGIADISKKIDLLATRKCVVEVRHRGE